MLRTRCLVAWFLDERQIGFCDHISLLPRCYDRKSSMDCGGATSDYEPGNGRWWSPCHSFALHRTAFKVLRECSQCRRILPDHAEREFCAGHARHLHLGVTSTHGGGAGRRRVWERSQDEGIQPVRNCVIVSSCRYRSEERRV